MIGAALATPADSQTAGSAAASAKDAPSEIRAAVMIVPPIAMEQNGSLTGFSVDLWNAIAVRLKLKTNYQVEPDVSSME